MGSDTVPSLTSPSYERLIDQSSSGAFVYNSDLDQVKRQFGKQHIQMLTLAGSIGTGLFLGLGEILAFCGPLGSLIVYTLVSSVVYSTILSVGEMTAFAPISGSLSYAAIWAIFWVIIFILISGISVFFEWSASKFIAAYINLPIFFCLWIGYKLWYKTRMLPLDELDFVTHIPTLEETGDEGLLLEKTSFAKRLRELI